MVIFDIIDKIDSTIINDGNQLTDSYWNLGYFYHDQTHKTTTYEHKS
jgi:hypothetical protein